MKKYIVFFTIIISLSGVIPIFGASKNKNKKTPDADEILQQGREAFFDYRFDEAAELYDTYKSLISKSKKPLDENFEIWEKQLEIATNSFDKVQIIEIIDSISVPSESFFKSYEMAQSAGNIGPSKSLGDGKLPVSEDLGFINEWKDYVISVSPNKEGELRLVENRRLLDGSWESHELLEGDFEKSGDYAFPFMSGDGQTFYFANNGENSMGGFDIFVAQKEPFTDNVLQPLNIGMPFNSPYDDFMMAVDEENGLGWWATNRNSEDGYITIFVYRLDEVRKNYPGDTLDLSKFARLNGYKVKQGD